MTYTWDRNYDIDQIGDSETSDGLYENYTLDAAGNVTLVNERVSTNVRTYEYDGLDRLTAQKNGATTIQAFTYDDTGNRLSKTESGTTTNYTYGTGTHHLTATGSTTRTYDGNGNTTAIGSTIGFAYNDRNRLSNIDFGSADRTYVYNGKGERVGRYFDATPASNLVFFYDEAGHLLGEYTPAGARVAEYVWMDDTLVAVYKTHDTSAYQYIETDYLGTPRAVVNTATNEVWWRWDVTPKAFGDNDVDNNPDGNGLIYNLALRYPGQYFDGLGWINYNYFRNYDATVGRYLESDPVGFFDDFSTYAYTSNNPLGAADPLGLWCVSLSDQEVDSVRSRRINKRWESAGVATNLGAGAVSCNFPDVWHVTMERKKRNRTFCYKCWFTCPPGPQCKAMITIGEWKHSIYVKSESGRTDGYVSYADGRECAHCRNPFQPSLWTSSCEDDVYGSDRLYEEHASKPR